MEELCGLFDPSDGHGKGTVVKDKSQTNANKKEGKGRRRGCRSAHKNETLPEESSFLCEPELSTDVLVKNGSYFENYFEINHKDDTDPKSDSEKKPKRRNSARKHRRRKSKVSPIKELSPPPDLCDVNLLNNETFIKKCTAVAENVGKGVNDLRDSSAAHAKSSKRKENSQEKQINNVIEKLERILKADADGLTDDADVSDSDGSFDDESSVTGPELSLPPEPRFGNVEYKLHLVAPSDTRLQHLVTQLKWRLVSGGGVAIYVLGVRDCGRAPGLPPRALRASLATVRTMCSRVGAACSHVFVRAASANRHVAELRLHQLSAQQSVELRVAVMGANEAGKSTLVGVLTQGELDNGRGSARLNMFRHVHEVRSGNTSSLSHEVLGFDAKGNVINYGCSELMTAERIGQRSAKLVSFLDLAGHSKYQRTTVHGLTGYLPHTAMLLVSATAGITPITEEHIGLLLALDLHFFTVITKSELEPSGIHVILEKLTEILANSNKKPLLITDEDGARNCVGPKKHILDSLGNGKGAGRNSNDNENSSVVAVFPVSCVRGFGLDALHAYLQALDPPELPNHSEESMEFQIDEIFHVCEDGGPVVGGLLYNGVLRTGHQVLIGPLETGEFVEITVKSIYRNRVPCNVVRAGQSASLGLSHMPPNLRQGMVLLTKTENFGKNVKNPNYCQNCRLYKKHDVARRKREKKKSKSHSESKNEIRNDNDTRIDKRLVRSINKNASVSTSEDDSKIDSSSENTDSQIDRYSKSDKYQKYLVNIKSTKSSEDEIQPKQNDNLTHKSYQTSVSLSSDDENNDANILINDHSKSITESDIETSKSDTETNKSDIEPNKSDTITNKSNNDTNIKINDHTKSITTSDIGTDKSDIETNKSHTKTNKSDIDTNITENLVQIVETGLTKLVASDGVNLYKSESDTDNKDVQCKCVDETLWREDPDNPRGCLYFQATIHLLRHSGDYISPGFQCTVHIGNVRQTAIIEGILSAGGILRTSERASVLFRLARSPERLAAVRPLLVRARPTTIATGEVTHVFPYYG